MSSETQQRKDHWELGRLQERCDQLQSTLQRRTDALVKAKGALSEMIAAAPHSGEGVQRMMACQNARETLTHITTALAEEGSK